MAEFMIQSRQFNNVYNVIKEYCKFYYVLFDIKDRMLLRAESDESERKTMTKEATTV